MYGNPNFTTIDERFEAPPHLLQLGNEMEALGQRFEESTRYLAGRFSLNKNQIRFGLENLLMEGPEAQRVASACDAMYAVPQCRDSVYRTFDGSCNNLHFPDWARANTCYARLVPPDYADGISAPRVAASGHALPNSRVVSLTIHPDVSVPDRHATHMLMQWGQWINHDVTNGPMASIGSQPLQCCPFNSNNHPQCLPILLPRDDPFFSQFGQTCMNFARSVTCPTCSYGPRQHINMNSGFIDASTVYGSSLEQAWRLRLNGTGYLRYTVSHRGSILLPAIIQQLPGDLCAGRRTRQMPPCFTAGDNRVNMHPAMTSIHTIFLRHHNNLVEALHGINPHWHADRLYEEARRIVIAQIQMIQYHEALPITIGDDYTSFFDLRVQTRGYTNYQDHRDPTLLTEFVTTAFRFGHSTISGPFLRVSPYDGVDSFLLRDNFFFPFMLYNDSADSIMAGLAAQPQETHDRFHTADVTNHLFKEPTAPFGLDLVATNLLRGRERGIPSYTRVLHRCFGVEIHSFNDLESYISSRTVRKLRKLYETVQDVDFFSGGSTEFPLPGAVVGPSFACVMGIQFHNLKFGDRYYFEHGGQTGSFTPAQLDEIRKTTFARIICDTTQVREIQYNVMLKESSSNPRVLCQYLPEVDLSRWADTSYGL